jgi:tetratricopeptide (TPR) repeat protein
MDNITWIGTITKGGLCVGKVLEIASNEKLIEIQENYINTLYKNKDFEACYNSCDYLLSLLPADPKAQKKMKRFCYLRQAVCLKWLGRYDESLEKADIAVEYCGKDDSYSILHMKALIHKERSEFDKSIKLIDGCIKWYRTNNMHYELAMMYATKGDIFKKTDFAKSESLLKQSIEEYEKALEEGNYYDKEMLIKEIDYAYERLVELYVYMGEQNMVKAYAAYKKLQTQEVQLTSHKTITNLFRKEV